MIAFMVFVARLQSAPVYFGNSMETSPRGSQTIQAYFAKGSESNAARSPFSGSLKGWVQVKAMRTE